MHAFFYFLDFTFDHKTSIFFTPLLVLRLLFCKNLVPQGNVQKCTKYQEAGLKNYQRGLHLFSLKWKQNNKTPQVKTTIVNHFFC
jgi:hypothetical protein